MVPETEACKAIYGDMCNLYEKHSNKGYSYWHEGLKYIDKHLNSQESLGLGLIDEIIEPYEVK